MKNNVKDNYNKALENYNNGNLDKAIKLCESCMSETLRFPAVLNLKGLILYQQGKLEEAIAVWKINREANADPLAKNYIKDSKNDEIRIIAYKEAEESIKNLEITRALEILSKCSESDFNCIRVNTAIGLCYFKKGEYKLCKEHLDKALEVDKNFTEAKEIKKELLLIYDEVNGKVKAKNKIAPLILATILIGSLGGIYYLNKGEDKSDSENNKQNITTNIDTLEEKKDVKLNSNQLKSAIKEKNFDKIHETINGVNEKSLNDEELKMYTEATKMIKKDGSIEFYAKGQKLYGNENYEKAKREFEKAAKYGKGIYIYEHVLYYLGNVELKLNNDKQSIEAFLEYEKKFKKGVYLEEAFYNLALLNKKSGNKEEAIVYAKKLKNNFPKSIYNNDKISEIIEKQI